MKICVIGGTGYVGLVTGIGLAAKNNNIICADIDSKKIDFLNRGILPIYEEGLRELLEKAKEQNRITFTTCLKMAITSSDIIIIAVGTPENSNGDTDISQFLKALKSVANHIAGYKLIVIKSTVPVGTCDMAYSFISKNLKNLNAKFDIVSNPEFLREGSAVKDFMFPERIILGSDTERSRLIMEDLYSSFNAPIISTDIKSSEMIKYACNAYLAARISFINEIAEICEKVNADIDCVIRGMKLDKRIGQYYLNPGPGFGGPCLSKDIKSLINFSSKANANVALLKAVLQRNKTQIVNIVNCINNQLMSIKEKKVAILGLSFKAGTNDIRNSPAINLIYMLNTEKIEIFVYDPVVKQIEEPLNSRVIFRTSVEEAVKDADFVVIMTEWEEFRNINLQIIYRLMRTPFIYDSRNVISREKAEMAGFRYKGVGVGSYNEVKGNKIKSII